jgi:hypothetical protein
MAIVIEVGALFPESYQPIYTQPGGIGTPVVPQQEVGELTGIYRSPCGHSLNSWETAWATVNGSQMAIVKCPLCGYINNIYTPAVWASFPILNG